MHRTQMSTIAPTPPVLPNTNHKRHTSGSNKRKSAPKGDDEMPSTTSNQGGSTQVEMMDVEPDVEKKLSNHHHGFRANFRKTQHHFSIFEAFMISVGNACTFLLCLMLVAMTILVLIFLEQTKTWAFALFLTLTLPLACSFLVIYYSCVVGGRTHTSRTKKCLSLNFWMSFMLCSIIIGMLIGMGISYPIIINYVA
mmetsp:Transcript_13485/g.20439  ORF Transcript_13485/g.20439 Transcript_13485/m.20439 type:complete len:196 (-) Transcript_13485:407-994(-)